MPIANPPNFTRTDELEREREGQEGSRADHFVEATDMVESMVEGMEPPENLSEFWNHFLDLHLKNF